ncbi:MAG: glycogen debranching protein GlgX, partial [Geminicoccaceae bacterium]|nr:glycogen debranching protein GlgX [Geminicoccaceae bacterium]
MRAEDEIDRTARDEGSGAVPDRPDWPDRPQDTRLPRHPIGDDAGHDGGYAVSLDRAGGAGSPGDRAGGVDFRSDRPAPDRLLPGRALRPGATVEAGGVNFALFSEHAERVELCLFDPADGREARRYDLPEHTDQVWHGFLPEAGAGLVYGYRVHGPFAPERGHRFDPTQVLLDPYARAWAGRFDARGGRPRSVVTPPPPIACGRRPGHDPADLVIYEAHVKGLTARHPDVASHRRGRYAALGEPAVIEHLHGLGITAIELMPCQAFVDEPFLRAKGLRNYWGYNPIGFFVPEPRYAATADAAGELREAVAALHDAGIEVLLDVVYNHTGEGDAQGPTLSFRGIDNRSYYKLDGDPLREVDVTGCGNTFDLAHPRVLQLVMDSLRFWVTSIGVDGFRFDLATALGRSAHGFDAGAGFFDAIRQDPVLAGVRLIAEPWDVGPEGYRLGGFGSSWSEWNDRFRDTVRGFWRGDEHLLPALAARLLGSADLFDHRGRRPFASINYVTAHDGFTLADLVAHEKRHNRANGEDNRDGHAHEISWNNGVEGPSDDPAVRDARARDMRNMLTTLFLAQGTPMLLMGDEIGRSQRGNNNAYC